MAGINIQLPPDLHKAVRIISVTKSQTLEITIVDLLRKAIR